MADEHGVEEQRASATPEENTTPTQAAQTPEISAESLEEEPNTTEEMSRGDVSTDGAAEEAEDTATPSGTPEPYDDKAEAPAISLSGDQLPLPTISLSTEEEPEVEHEEANNSIAVAPEVDQQERELPPLPEASPTSSVPPLNAISTGIPIPLKTEGLDPSPEGAVEPPKTPETPGRPWARSSPVPRERTVVTSASLAQSNSTGQVTISSMVFVVQALETIGSSKEARRRKPLGDAVQIALDAIKETAPEPPADPTVIFEPLRIACSLPNTQLVTTALDCIGKLISYSYFSIVPPHVEKLPAQDEEETEPEPPLIELAIETICDCFQGEQTPDTVQLQIVKALLSAVLNDKAVVHGAGLLKAVRQTYNIFLLSRNSANQQTAQGTLTQMVHTVFERVKQRMAVKEAKHASSQKNPSSTTLNGNSSNADMEPAHHKDDMESVSTEGKAPEKITLQSFENRKSFDDDKITDSAPTTVTPSMRVSSDAITENSREEDEEEIFVKDAFLVFRAMCKLSIKTLPAEQIADLKSHGMRSKLLSLHLIHVILLHHMDVFLSPFCGIKSSSSGEPTGFIHAIKQYICLSLSRNAASAVGNVFEVCCEIFWLMMTNMRVTLKVCLWSAADNHVLIMGNRKRLRCSSKRSILRSWITGIRVCSKNSIY